MPATPTPRLALAAPVGVDPPAEYRIAITTNANALDGAMMYLAGTLAAQPAANTVPDGTLYRATDTGQWFLGNGTAWGRVGGRQPHSFTMSDHSQIDPATGIVGSFFIAPDIGEDVRLVAAVIHCVTVGATPSVFNVQTDSAAHGTLSNVTGLTGLTPGTTQTLVTPSSPVVLASLDRVCVVATNAGNSLGVTITLFTQHSP